MLALMLVTAINYQSSLIYLLVFVLGAIFVVSIWLCFFNLQGLVLRVSKLSPVEAGQPFRLTLIANSAGKERSGYYCSIEGGAEDKHWPVEKEETIELTGTTHVRGVYGLPGICVETFFPFGLIRGWTWVWFDSPIVVYPTPLESPDAFSDADSGSAEKMLVEGEDLGEQRLYQQGDALRRVLWRHFARRGELVVRSPEPTGKQRASLEWDAYVQHGVELALSYMCFDVLALHSSNAEFEMSLPGLSVELGSGDQHRDRCLDALARFRG